jgi:DNA-binding beta-propeller fold protein YncE
LPHGPWAILVGQLYWEDITVTKTLFSQILGLLLIALWHGTGAEVLSPNGLLLVCNKGNRTLSVVDPKRNSQIAAVGEDGVTGHEVAASLDGSRAFVPIYGNSGVGKPGTDGRLLRVIDIAKGEIVGTVDFGKGVRPHCAVMDPSSRMLFVTTELENCVTIIDPATLKIVGTVPTGQAESHMLAIARDGRRGYTANAGPGTVSVLDLADRKLLKVIPVSGALEFGEKSGDPLLALELARNPGISESCRLSL